MQWQRGFPRRKPAKDESVMTYQVDFADLGVLEFVWLLLALGGLSLVAPGSAWRRRAALGVAVFVALFGAGRLLAHEGGHSAWDRWIGPVLFAPVFGAALVLPAVVRAARFRDVEATLQVRHLAAFVSRVAVVDS